MPRNGILKQTFFRQKPKVRGQRAEHDGRVHIAQVIRDEHVADSWAKVFHPLRNDFHAGDLEERFSPESGYRALRGRRGEGGNGRAADGGQDDERVDNQEAPDKPTEAREGRLRFN